MSTTEIYGFDEEGYAYFVGETKNAWFGAMAIWGILEKRYLPPYIPDYVKYCNWYRADMSYEEIVRRNGFEPSRTFPTLGKDNPTQEIWDLADNENVSVTDKIVLFTTFDRCLVKKADIPKVIEAFLSFVGETSLKEQADILQQAFDDAHCIAVGWNQTSVNSKTWGSYGYDEKSDEHVPYNCLTQNEHYWLFDELSTEFEGR